MSKIESHNFKYDIPDNSKYSEQLEDDGDIQLVHEDDDEEDSWNEVSDESFDGEDNNGEKRKDEFSNYRNRKSYKKPFNTKDRKK